MNESEFPPNMRPSPFPARVSAPGEGKLLPLLGILKASDRDSAGRFEVIEYRGPLQPPPHVHRQREEVFYILEGSFNFTLGHDDFPAPTGSLVVVPRGTRHGFSTDDGGRALLFITPAGLEGFFEELGTGLQAGKTGTEMRVALADRYDSFPDDPPGGSTRQR